MIDSDTLIPVCRVCKLPLFPLRRCKVTWFDGMQSEGDYCNQCITEAKNPPVAHIEVLK